MMLNGKVQYHFCPNCKQEWEHGHCLVPTMTLGCPNCVEIEYEHWRYRDTFLNWARETRKETPK